ncbi:hypothetical protein M426DRAFT_23235 [Hypoxylon sp. CI-4A]|nr:hypothetical protein M426DRAFT_23235 [Hypoxylon sp. CI-4A]
MAVTHKKKKKTPRSSRKTHSSQKKHSARKYKSNVDRTLAELIKISKRKEKIAAYIERKEAKVAAMNAKYKRETRLGSKAEQAKMLTQLDTEMEEYWTKKDDQDDANNKKATR